MADNKKIFSVQIQGLKESVKDTESLAQTLQKLNQIESEENKSRIASNQTIREYTNLVNQQVKATNSAEGSIRQMQAQLAIMRKEYDNLSKAEREDVNTGGQLLKNIQELDAALKSAKEETGRFQESVGNYEKATVSLKAQLRQLKGEMASMLANGVSPTDAAYDQLAKKAGKIKDAISDAGESISKFASDTRAIDNVISVGKTLASTFGLVQSTMTLFGMSNENTQKQIAKLAAVMTVLQSLQTVAQELTTKGTIVNKAYEASIAGISKVKALFTTVTKAQTVAQEGETVATTASSVAMGVFKKALISTGIGAFIVLLGELIAHWSDITDWVGKKCPAAFNTLKQVAMGVVNVVIGYVKNMAKAIDDLVHLHFKDAAKDAIQAYNIVGNYNAGKEKEMVNQHVAAQRAKVQADINYKEQYFKNLDAQGKSDDKYLAKNRKIYLTMLRERLSLLQKGTQEYQDVINEMVKFNGECRDKDNAAASAANEKAKQRADELKQKRKQAAEEARQKEQEYQNTLKATNRAIEDYYAELGILADDDRQKIVDEALKTVRQLKEAEADELKNAKTNSKDKQELAKLTNAIRYKYELQYNIQRLKLNDDLYKYDEEQTKKAKEELDKRADNVRKAIKEETNEVDKFYKNVERLSKDTEVVKRNGLLDIDKTKANYARLLQADESYKKKLEQNQVDIASKYDKIMAMYPKDSEEYKKAQDEKESALEQNGIKLETINKKIQTDQKNSNKIMQTAAKDLADKMQTIWGEASKVMSSVFNSINEIIQGQLDDIQERLDEVGDEYDSITDRYNDSVSKLKDLEDEAKTASGGRAEAIADSINREMEYNKSLAAQQKQLAKEKEQLEKEQARKEKQQKKMTLGQNLITSIANTALGITKALADYSWPFSAVVSAIVGAMGALESGVIISQMSKLEKGGLIRGKSHAQGGARIEGTNIEVEGDEYVVNKKTTKKNLGLIDYINKAGDKEIMMSDVIKYYKSAKPYAANNTFKQKFADGGILPSVNVNSNVNNQALLDAIDRINFNPVVSVEEINRVNNRIVAVKELAGAN